MTYDHCPNCGSGDISEVDHDSSCHSTTYCCDDCGYEFEIEDDLFGYDTSWGWQDSVEEDE